MHKFRFTRGCPGSHVRRKKDHVKALKGLFLGLFKACFKALTLAFPEVFFLNVMFFLKVSLRPFFKIIFRRTLAEGLNPSQLEGPHRKRSPSRGVCE